MKLDTMTRRARALLALILAVVSILYGLLWIVYADLPVWAVAWCIVVSWALLLMLYWVLTNRD